MDEPVKPHGIINHMFWHKPALIIIREDCVVMRLMKMSVL